MAFDLRAYLDQYNQDHQHPVNRALHNVGIPMILMIFFGWARNDIRHATVVDAELEAERPTRTAPGVAQPPPLERPWWESDPRFRNPRS